MRIGQPLIAPHGFEVLKSDRVYHFLFGDGPQSRVLLLTFGAPVASPPEANAVAGLKHPRPDLVLLRRDRFEEAIRSELIRDHSNPHPLPHWLGDWTVAELIEHDKDDHLRRVPHSQRIDAMLAHIWPAVEQVAAILGSESPEAQLNRYARRCTPPQHETRFRTAFFAYVAFGLERMALHYPIDRIGKWDRAERNKKFGRPSALGAQHGHSSCDEAVIALCLQGYKDYSGPGQSMRQIYRKTMVRIFGCTVVTGARQRISFVHPDGKPFPSFGQFQYRVGQAFDLQTRQLLKFGSARVRSRIAPSQGSYTTWVGNAMEILQYDGFFIDEVCVGYLPSSYLPRICVVRAICVGSGMVVGVGFSLRGETAEAYRMATFCMAVDKVWFCSLFGIRITEAEWPSAGLPLHQVTDRGPGATKGAQGESIELQPMINELVSAYSGQSKATVETRHPKSVKTEGAPQFKVTRQSVVQVVRREIWRAIESNKSTNMTARLGPAAVAERTLPTPISVWNHLDQIGRTFAYQVKRDQVIRNYLSKVDLTVQDGAIYFMGFRYWSKALRDSELLERATTRCQGYLLPACVRHIFIDTPDGILQVDASFGIRTDGEELSLSLAELEQLAQLRAEQQAEFREHREAARADVAERFEAETGIPFDQAEIRPGRAKRGSTASQEEARQVMPLLRASGGRR
ncbi:hypothetical protein [Ideonella sp.]|uniref:hypothetical protein n=1 Tax=Ideonella sp. TaxID=1929293 RepID=UPI003BB75815